MRLHFQPDAQVPPAVRDCELSVLNHWYGDTPELLDEAYGPYEENQTVFLWLSTEDDQVVGFARLLRPGPVPLKTIVDVAGPLWNVDGVESTAQVGIDLSRTWDIATIGVRTEVLAPQQRKVAAQTLYHAVARSAMANGAEWVIGILDQHVWGLVAGSGLRMFQLPGTGPAEYMGSSACMPVYAHISTTLAEQERQNPQNYRRGEDGAVDDGGSRQVTVLDQQDLVLPPEAVSVPQEREGRHTASS
jgi:N-acyl-L-homoserine lactone synthetase